MVLNGPTPAIVMDQRPTAIFLDVWMLGSDGREICLNLKADPLTRETPIVLTSANNDTLRFAASCGADDVLLKPFEMDEVLRIAGRYARRATEPSSV